VIQTQIAAQGTASQATASIERMCELAHVSRAGFYRDWQKSQPQEAEVPIHDAVQKAALQQRQYGYRRIWQTLKRQGILVGQGVVRRILRQDNLLAIRKRKFVVSTDSTHRFTVYPNLARYVKVTAINQLWVADITYLRLRREFLYLAVVLDVFSRRVVGWSLGRSLQTTLPLAALNQAIATRQPSAGLLHHSDRGSQYASQDYVQRLEAAGMVISMSRPAKPWENAYCESFLSTLKREQLSCARYANLEELQQHIEEFIEQFYNRQRLHSALAYCSPEEFEQKCPSPALPAALSFPRHKEIFPDA
jgi:transposase InsO family protein